MHVVIVDRRTTEDLMGWKAIARALNSRPAGSGGVALLHAPGELTERVLEGDGVDLRGDDGLLAAELARDREFLVRAVRTENRRNVSQLSEEGISAVGFIGGDRGLFGTGEKLPWIADVTAAGAVPVVAAITDGTDGTREVPLAVAGEWLATALEAEIVCLVDDPPANQPARKRLTARSARDPNLARALVSDGISVRFSTVSGLAELRSDF